MITVTGQSEFDDYLRAQRFHGRSQFLFVAFMLCAVSLFIWLASHEILFPVFAFIYLLIIRPVYTRKRLKRDWLKTPSAHEGQKTYVLDEKGFHSEDDEGNPVVLHWDKFLKFKESKDLFLFYLSPRRSLFLPKRLISPEDQEAIRGLMKDRMA